MKKLFLVLAINYLALSCDRINPKTEPFYCKINGKKFIPETDNSPFGGIGSSPLKISRDLQYGWLYIEALNRPQSVSISIKLDANEVISVKEYILSNDIKTSTGSYYYDILASSKDRERLLSSTGKINITKIEGKKIWGTFEFKTKSTKINQEFDITDGRINGISY